MAAATTAQVIGFDARAIKFAERLEPASAAAVGGPTVPAATPVAVPVAPAIN